jgi:hypothetical protein
MPAEPMPCANCQTREWIHEGAGPLICAACGKPWPGEPLTAPPQRVEGYSGPDGVTPERWNQQVKRMLRELDRAA